MRLNFDSTGHNYLEIKQSSPGKVLIVLSAQDGNNHLNSIVNSAEVKMEDLIPMLKELGLNLNQKEDVEKFEEV